MNGVYSSLNKESFTYYKDKSSIIKGTPFAITTHYSEDGVSYYSFGGVIPGVTGNSMLYEGVPVNVSLFIDGYLYEYVTYDSAVAGAISHLSMIASEHDESVFSDIYRDNAKDIFDQMIKLDIDTSNNISVIIQFNILNIEYNYDNKNKNLFLDFEETEIITVGNSIGFVTLLNPKIYED